MRENRSYKALKSRIRDSSMSVDGRLLWLIIDSFADKNGENAFPGTGKLMQLAGKDRKWLFRHLNELEKAGWLIRGKIPGERGLQHNQYLLIYPNGIRPKYSRIISSKNGTRISSKNGTLPVSSLPVEKSARFCANGA